MADKRWTGASSGDANTAGNYSPSGVPTTGDHLTFPAGAPSVTASLTALTGVVLGTVKIEKGYTGTIGVISSTTLTHLAFQCDRLEVDGSGTYALDIESSNISPIVYGTGTPATGYHGLYLKGSNIATLNALGGNTVVAGGVGNTSTLATLRTAGGAVVRCSSGVTLTTAIVSGGTVTLDCALTTLTVNLGTCTTTGTGAITTVNARGGVVYLNSSGTITTLALDGGIADLLTSQVARTITNWSAELPSTLRSDTNYVTFTNNPPQITGAFSMTMAKA